MRTLGAFMASLVVAFVVLSVLADSGASTHIDTGTVAEVHAGEWMLVANQGGAGSRSLSARRRPTRAILLPLRPAVA